MARTLKDVYIKVTEKNFEELHTLLNRKIRVGYYLYFLSEDIGTSWLAPDAEENKQKVSLSQLKRLIDTIPTREEITRLKRQISAYKTNYDKVVKHSLSKEEVIEDLTIQNDKLKSYTSELNKEIKQLNEMYDDLVVESEKKQNLLKNLYDDALKENDELNKDIEALRNTINQLHDDERKYVEKTNNQYNELSNMYFNKINEIERLKYDFEQLKNKKWWQIWK